MIDTIKVRESAQRLFDVAYALNEARELLPLAIMHARRTLIRARYSGQRGFAVNRLKRFITEQLIEEA